MTLTQILGPSTEVLEVLKNFQILNTPSEEEYDDLVEMAAEICKTKFAAISFVDRTGTWFKAKKGLPFSKLLSDNSFCSSNWLCEDIIEVNDAYADVRFFNNPYVHGSLGIRFFAGVPLKPVNGKVIGHLFVFDEEPGELNSKKIKWLKRLAGQVECLLNQRMERFSVSNNRQRDFKVENSGRSVNRKKTLDEKINCHKALLEKILNSIPTDIVVFDKNHKYTFVNPQAIKDDHLREFIVGKDDFEYAEYRGWDVSIAEQRRQKFLEIKRTRKEIKWEDTITDKNGNSVTNLRRLFPVFDENDELEMVIGYGIDISERKLLEETLKNQLLDQNRQLIDFCNVVSHNLRAPLVNISLLKQHIEESQCEEERKLLLKMFDPVIENLNNTFSKLVESIQIKHDHEVESEILYFSNYLKRILKEYNKDIEVCELSIEPDFHLAPQLFFPSKYLECIFYNLLTNAVKYRSPDRKLVIKIKTEKKENSIILSVEDNGLGLDVEKHKENLFKIGKVFHKNPNAKGIGLFMAKTKIENMGGNIWVKSTPGKGSKFFVEFKNQYL